MKNKLTIALSYYNAPLMLREQIRNWMLYPEHLLGCTKILVIDDGSMVEPAEKLLKNAPLRVPLELYRITKDIPQNIWGARNLAFHIASVEREPWVLCLDIDHVLPSRGLDGFSIAAENLSKDRYYHMRRYQKEEEGMGLTLIGNHSDTYLMSPSLFWKVGGYDETLTEFYYNGAGFKFRNTLASMAKNGMVDKMYTVFYPSSIISDASPLENTTKKSYQGLHANNKPSVLNFEWERVL